MPRFPDLPIGRKLVVVGVAASTVALAVSTAIFFLMTVVALRDDIEKDLNLQAVILGDNVASSVAFREPDTAIEALAALQASSTIDMACLYFMDGPLFRGYAANPAIPCPATFAAVPTSVDTGVMVVRDVVHRKQKYGKLYMRGNFGEVRDRLAAHVVGAIVAIALGVAAAVLLSARIQRVVAGPIQDLSSTALKISQAGDYSLRATKRSDDEIGQLVETFNTMVAEVERRDEQLRSASRLKDEFLAALSHELRTPLNAVLGWIQVLRLAPYDPALTARAYLSIERNARAQTALIEDLLDISRVVTGKLHFKVEVVDLTAIVEAALEVVRPAAEAKSITIERQLLPSPQHVLGDANRLQQIAWNVLSNAVKFTAGGGRVEVSLGTVGDNYVLEVADDGVGIAPEFLPHVFDRFRQADGSLTRPHGGLGLGLAIARELTELHGGRIVARSAGSGRGTTLTVTLPRSAASPRVAAGPAPGNSADAPRLDGTTVLVIDDDEDTRELGRLVLASAGADVLAVSSGAEALRLLAAKRHVDIIMCDLAMPGMDGYELMRTIRADEASTGRSIPAIAVSAHAGATVEARARDAGFQGFMAKPYNLEPLLASLNALRLKQG
jgi:signal transduction histidine kinase